MTEYTLAQVDLLQFNCRKALKNLLPEDQQTLRSQWSPDSKEQKFEHVWSSNAIEGAKVGLRDTTKILDKGLTGNGNRISDLLATLDLGRAYDDMLFFVKNQTPISEQMIKELHYDLTKLSEPDISGQYRTTAVHPAQSTHNPYSQPFEIRPQMEDLVKWIPDAQARLHPVAFAAQLHLKFVTIHPFQDGNGRLARLLMNMALLENGYPLVNILPDSDHRGAYLDALEACQTSNGIDGAPLENLVASYVGQIYKNRLAAIKLKGREREWKLDRHDEFSFNIGYKWQSLGDAIYDETSPVSVRYHHALNKVFKDHFDDGYSFYMADEISNGVANDTACYWARYFAARVLFADGASDAEIMKRLDQFRFDDLDWNEEKFQETSKQALYRARVDLFIQLSDKFPELNDSLIQMVSNEVYNGSTEFRNYVKKYCAEHGKEPGYLNFSELT
ncbi:Putative uncharacterized protein [Lactobacillus equicursoris DSM 19284 = JCM 14600 = CIP 110162]|nr:Fic family protein [Lactobacillus equicursoris]CCK85080.1 Putative uncharacterized protein [Lactobacillus equicursoris DSM 19284 = JCM 14600 = CIP 110162]